MNQYKFETTIWIWIAIVYGIGMFIPLMNNDAAHHANIALHMFLQNDYVNLVDQGRDYLDKPHLLFWLASLSYELFGVNSFSYKLPSLLFSILAIYSTFKLGQLLYGRVIGHWSALILATSFAFVLANNDVRMDAILTGSIIFSIWQGLMLIEHQKNISIFLLSLGLSAGFSVKGMIGVVVPGISLGIYVLAYKKYKNIINWKWIAVAIITMLFSSPVLFCYYKQFDLHPEKIIRGHDHISGIKFILWLQNFERFKGEAFGSNSGSDPLFFLHTFLWAFLPWSILAFFSIFHQLSTIVNRSISKRKLFLLGTTGLIFILISLSNFKLPHYLNILLPLFSIITARYLVKIITSKKSFLAAIRCQYFIIAILLIALVILHGWIFPLSWINIIITAIFIIITLNHLRKIKGRRQVAFCSLYVGILLNLLFNINYYPQLLQYQAGQELAKEGKKMKLSPLALYYINSLEKSNSFDFEMGTIIPSMSLEKVKETKSKIYFYTGTKGLNEFNKEGIPFRILASRAEYHVSTPKLKFLLPTSRAENMTKHYLVSVN